LPQADLWGLILPQHFDDMATTRQNGLLPSNGQRGAVSVDRKQMSYMFVFWRVADDPTRNGPTWYERSTNMRRHEDWISVDVTAVFRQ